MHGTRSRACPTSARRSPKSATADFGCSRPSFETRRKDAALLRACESNKVVEAVDRLVRRRFMICDDTQDIVTRLLQAGLAAGVPAPSSNETASAPNPVPACIGRPHHRYHHVYDRDGDRD
jgi:hypothetical protein